MITKIEYRLEIYYNYADNIYMIYQVLLLNKVCL